MTCEEFQALAAAHALGALDPDEAAAAEAHLREVTEHPACFAAAARARATMAAFSAALPPARPGDAVWTAIEARAGLGAPKRRRGAPLAWAVAALAAGLAAVAWVGASREATRARSEAAVARAEAGAAARDRDALAAELRALQGAAASQRALAALLGAPGSQVVPLAPVPGAAGSAVAVVNVAARQGVVVTSTLAAPAGKVLQLWVLRGKAAPIPAGFLRPEGQVLVGALDPRELQVAPDAVAVSLEPEGGSAAPTDIRLVGKLAG